MKMLTGYLAPCEGQARIAGFDVDSNRLDAAHRLGYLPENGPLYTEMTPESFLTHVGETRCMSTDQLRSRLDYVANMCSLKDVWRKPIGKLSRGYRQRVGMAQALLHDPEVLILDEPTSGLDPNQVRDVRDLISELAENKTILLSTHILREVHACCSRVLLINEGRLVFDGLTEELGKDDSALESKFHKLTLAAV
jgi:ABC-2 type transport system ATP-binding protein